jgi:hypothetical protein
MSPQGLGSLLRRFAGQSAHRTHALALPHHPLAEAGLMEAVAAAQHAHVLTHRHRVEADRAAVLLRANAGGGGGGGVKPVSNFPETPRPPREKI